MANWFETGFGAINKEEERNASGILPNNFYLKVDEKKPIIFIDDDVFSFYEHTVKLQGNKFYTNITCIKGAYPDDPQCCYELGLKSNYLVGYSTVIDLSEKKDPKYGFELQLFQSKLRTLKKLRSLKEDKASLVNIIWKVSRTDEKAPRVGDSFMYDKDVKDMNKLYKQVTFRGKKISELFDTANRQGAEAIDRIKKTFQVVLNAEGKIEPIIPAFNYAEILKPLEPRNMRDLLRTRVKEAGFESTDTRTSGFEGADF